MSTRTRLLLTYNGGGYLQVGWRVIPDLINRSGVGSNFVKHHLKSLRYNEMTKREKLLALISKLPSGFKLTMIQEPKKTRKNKSLYWKARLAIGGINGNR